MTPWRRPTAPTPMRTPPSGSAARVAGGAPRTPPRAREPGTVPQAVAALHDAARDALDDGRPGRRRVPAACAGRAGRRGSPACSSRSAAPSCDSAIPWPLPSGSPPPRGIEDRLRAEVGLDLARALVMAGRCHTAVGVLDDLVAELRRPVTTCTGSRRS